MTNTIKMIPNALLLADVLAGREPAESQGSKRPTVEEAFAKAQAHFSEMGADSHEGYLAHRAAVKAGLRRLTKEIRSAKAEIRYLDGDMSGYWKLSSELGKLRAEFADLHDLRRLGKAWSPLARQKQQQAADAA
ncbi:MAG: hypothetical protein ABJN42_03675 [Roseibium sp.]|uniref:hypothetical protein n=1 Tax=Roseibium sp. TaxID=1936156 RepID=UPI003297DDA8